MNTYFFKRIFALIPVLIGVSLITFSLMYFVSGDVVTDIVGERASEEIRQKAIEELGLDKPFHEQYLMYMKRLVRGDLGKSYINNKSVAESIRERFPITLKLALMIFIISTVIEVAYEIIDAMKQHYA